VKSHNWFAVEIDLVIVEVGVFIGMQVFSKTNKNQDITAQASCSINLLHRRRRIGRQITHQAGVEMHMD